jgi:hypothetical protein
MAPTFLPRRRQKCFVASVFSKFFRFVRTVTANAVFGAPLETGKGKTGWLLLLMGLLASPPPMLMN